MLNWIAGKGSQPTVTISPENIAQLAAIADVLGQQSPDLAALSPQQLLNKILQGQIVLTSTTAQQAVDLSGGQVTPSNITPQSLASASQPAADSDLQKSATMSDHARSKSGIGESAAPLPDVSGEPSPVDPRDQHIQNLKAQITYLQNRLNQKHDQQAALQAKYLAIVKKTRQQEQAMEELQAQVAQLRQAANIGEAQLNRWRFNHFSR